MVSKTSCWLFWLFLVQIQQAKVFAFHVSFNIPHLPHITKLDTPKVTLYKPGTISEVHLPHSDYHYKAETSSNVFPNGHNNEKIKLGGNEEFKINELEVSDGKPEGKLGVDEAFDKKKENKDKNDMIKEFGDEVVDEVASNVAEDVIESLSEDNDSINDESSDDSEDPSSDSSDWKFMILIISLPLLLGFVVCMLNTAKNSDKEKYLAINKVTISRRPGDDFNKKYIFKEKSKVAYKHKPQMQVKDAPNDDKVKIICLK